MLTLLFASTGTEGGIDVIEVLLDLMIVLLAAKVGAEAADRVGAPTVVGEILAGIAVGPSALGLVGNDAVLPVLAEIGVILLLLEVGLEMNLGELAKVGRSSMQVAVTGVVVPFALGFAVMEAFGEGGNTSLFIGAALTATSVGITARVFGDLRALATSEARTVLGAAVADDVLGLVILTVVVRIVTEGSVSVSSVAGIIAVAVLFLVGGGLLASLLAPPVFARVQRFGRSPGVLLVAVVVFTLAMAELANSSKLAPIIGAFVAGLALTRTRQAERVRRDLAPLSHVFVPVFFVMIGVNSDVTQFAEPSVLGLAAVLVVVGVVGKVVAGWAASGPGDRRLIGIGMIPRGEVGLIFAGIGLREGVLGENLYASLLLVVLVTTLMTPPLLAMRYKRLQRGTASGVVSAEAPEGGWLRVDDDVIDLAATPPDDLAVPIAFAAATQVVSRRPGPALLDWLGGLPDGAFSWDAAGSRLLLDLLRHGNERSWRFLSVTGILERALPELAASIERRRRDPGNLDPGAVMRWSTVQLVHDELDELGARAQDRVQLARPELVVLAALLLDVTAQDDDASETTAALLARLRLPTEDAAEIMLLVAETDLLAAASHRFDALAETAITPLAIHLRTTETTDALFVLTRAQGGLEPVAERRLEQIRRFVVATIDELSEGRPHLVDVLEARRSRALSSCITARAAERVVASPRQWLLSQPPGVLAAQAASLDPVPGPHDIGVRFDPEQRRLDVVSRDRVGLLAAITDALESAGLDIVSASAATWPDDVALSVFTIGSGGPVDVEALRVGVLDRLDTASPPDRVGDATVTFDQLASPWYTVVVVEAGDRPGLLHDVTAALAGAGARIHAARVRTVDGRAEDSFEVTDERGAKLSAANQERIRALLIGDATAPAAGRGRRRR